MAKGKSRQICGNITDEGTTCIKQEHHKGNCDGGENTPPVSRKKAKN